LGVVGGFVVVFFAGGYAGECKEGSEVTRRDAQEGERHSGNWRRREAITQEREYGVHDGKRPLNFGEKAVYNGIQGTEKEHS